MKLKVMTFNICHGAEYPELLKKYTTPLCFGYHKSEQLFLEPNIEELLDEWHKNVNLTPIARLIQTLDCDIIGLNEVRGAGEAAHYTNQAEWLASKTGRYFYFAKATEFPGEGSYGTALLSRFPIKSGETIPIPPIAEEPGREPRCLLKAVVEAQQDITVFVSHFGGHPLEQRNAVNCLLLEMKKTATPILFLGDLNAVPESDVLKPLYNQMEEAFSEGNPFTFPSFQPERKIDYIFASKPARFENSEVAETVISDHYPLRADVLF